MVFETDNVILGFGVALRTMAAVCLYVLVTFTDDDYSSVARMRAVEVVPKDACRRDIEDKYGDDTRVSTTNICARGVNGPDACAVSLQRYMLSRLTRDYDFILRIQVVGPMSRVSSVIQRSYREVRVRSCVWIVGFLAMSIIVK